MIRIRFSEEQSLVDRLTLSSGNYGGRLDFPGEQPDHELGIYHLLSVLMLNTSGSTGCGSWDPKSACWRCARDSCILTKGLGPWTLYSLAQYTRV
jgi:hypothetical protein